MISRAGRRIRPEVEPDELRVARRGVLERRLGHDPAGPGRGPAAGRRRTPTNHVTAATRPAGERASAAPRRRRRSRGRDDRSPVDAVPAASRRPDHAARDPRDDRRPRVPRPVRRRRRRAARRDHRARPSAGWSRARPPRPGCAAGRGSSSRSPSRSRRPRAPRSAQARRRRGGRPIGRRARGRGRHRRRCRPWNVSHSLAKPLSGGRPLIAAAPIPKATAVTGIARARPPRRLRSRLPAADWTEPAARNRADLNRAWLRVWNRAAVRATAASGGRPVAGGEERDPDADQDDPDVLDAVEGEQALEVVLHERVQHAEHRRCDADRRGRAGPTTRAPARGSRARTGRSRRCRP